jgi:hypothetical protein
VANTLKPKRRTSDGTAPTTGNLVDGELAVNSVTRTLYLRVATNVIAVANYFSGAFADLSGKPTTLAGYGITDAALDAAVLHTTAASETVLGTKTFTNLTSTGTTILGGRPADFWTSSSQMWVGTVGWIGTNGSFATSIFNNGYRNNLGGFTVMGVNGVTDKAAGIDLTPTAITLSIGAPTGTSLPTRLRVTETDAQFNGNSLWHAGTFNPASKLDLSLYDSAAATPNTVAGRNGSGDIHARLLRQTFADQATMSGGLVFRVNNSTDNYLRVCNAPTAVLGWLGLGTESNRITASNGTDGLRMGAYTSANFGAIWHSALTPAADNYTLAARNDGTQTYLNALTNLNFQINNVPQVQVTSGEITRKNANSTTLTRIPRIFVQSTDPGAAAADGDLWFW